MLRIAVPNASRRCAIRPSWRRRRRPVHRDSILAGAEAACPPRVSGKQGDEELKLAAITRDDVAKRLDVSISTVRRLEGTRLHSLIDDKGVRPFQASDSSGSRRSCKQCARRARRSRPWCARRRCPRASSRRSCSSDSSSATRSRDRDRAAPSTRRRAGAVSRVAGGPVDRRASAQGAGASGSDAKKMSPTPAPYRAVRSASASTRRFIATSPPTPFSLKPSPSWIGRNCAEITATKLP